VLQTLTDAGLLSSDDQAILLKASIQSNEDYQRRIQAWLERHRTHWM
jgi:hypothetical protein